MARRYRLIIWGPGEVGGATLRVAQASDRFEIVGVKVFSPRKDGKDAGELVGIGPIGVKATRSKAEILALDADCVIVTPQPRAVFEGLDADVIDLLESGKNVISTAAYHNVAMPNWFNQARSPTARLREMALMGAAPRAWERGALAIVRAGTAFRALDPVTDLLLRPVADRQVPARASADRLLEACRKGHTSLHGTGVHPTFMVERHLMRVCRSLSRISHIRFAEAGDFARVPEGMWGGLSFLGFGRDPHELGADSVVAKAGDLYYGDMIGNVAHATYGAMPAEVRVERALRGIPAHRDIQVGSTRIRAGMTAALHLTHRGYLGEHHFFTNEECWYLGAENAFFGDDVPFGRLPAHGGYTFDITGEPTDVRGQISFPELRPDMSHPITIMSVKSLLNAVEPVCRAAPGILIDDARPSYRRDDVAPSGKVRARQNRPYRVLLWGASSDLGSAVRQAAQDDPRVKVRVVVSRDELFAAEADCVVVAPGPLTPARDIDAMLLALLESGKNVVSAAADDLPAAHLWEACQRGGTSIHRVGVHATLMISRMVMTMVQGLSSVRSIRIVEALDLSSVPECWTEAAALGFGRATAEFVGTRPPVGSGNLAHVIATVARDLYAAEEADIRIEGSCRHVPAERAFAIERGVIEVGSVAAIGTIHRGYVKARHVFTSEEWRYFGAENAPRIPDLPYGGFRGPASYIIQIRADPADLESQWNFEPTGATDPVSHVCARMILNAIGPVIEAEPGVLVEDPSPRYQHDDRVEREESISLSAES